MSPDQPEQPSNDIVDLEQFARDVVTRVTADGRVTLDQILPLVYDEFRTLAAHLLRRERPSHTLRPTALANEAYLRLADQTGARLEGRAHLLSIAATTMRRVLIDHARARSALKRGAGQEHVTLGDEILDGAAGKAVDILDLHRSLEKLATLSPRKVKVVELLYFGGLTNDEAAEALGVSAKTIMRDWRSAKAWLWSELSKGQVGEDQNTGH